MALEVNGHVSRLRRFQPFHPESGDLIYELSNPNEPTYEMVALGFLKEAIATPEVRLIILTGDAGHGKTSLSAAALQTLDMDSAAASAAIQRAGDASGPIAETPDGRPVWLFSDLSNVDLDGGTELLRRLRNTPEGGVAIVCANEGRLRAAVSLDATGELSSITETLERGIVDGSVSSVSNEVVVLNLNFQSVAPESGGGLVDWALKTWASDKRRWGVCSKCDARAVCPIFANHQELSDSEAGSGRVSAVRDLFSTAERAGQVITTRQALALVSHAITGGLSCEEVHKHFRADSEDKRWQYPHLYHQALFGGNLTRAQRRFVPPFTTLRSLDPATIALRSVDDHLDPEASKSPFLPPLPAVDGGTPNSRREAQRESKVMRDVISFLRRADYFDAPSRERLERMGLRSGHFFTDVCANGTGSSVEVRDVLLRGLEAVQGIYRGDVPDFLILDPAFFSARSRAAVIARRLKGRDVELVSQAEQWRLVAGTEPQLPSALDWSNRSVFLRITADDSVVSLELNLLTFELLIRWAEGLSSRIQHEPEIRSIAGVLAALVPSAGQIDDIDVLVGRDKRTLTIDVGDLIRSGGV